LVGVEQSIATTDLSVRRQCALPGLARYGVYGPRASPIPKKVALMRWLDAQRLI
jgi:hypothetical protein